MSDRDDLRDRLDAVDERLTGGDQFDGFDFTVNWADKSANLDGIEVEVYPPRADWEGDQ